MSKKYTAKALKSMTKQPKVRIGSIVRLKRGNRKFLGMVKAFKDFGDVTVEGDYSVLLEVLWLQDPNLRYRPTLNEVEVLS